MRVCKTVILLGIALTTTLQINAQRLKASVDKEVKVKSVELNYEGRSAGPMMFFDARKHGLFGLTISSKVRSAVWSPISRDILSERDLRKLGGLKKLGYAPIKFTHLEGGPAILVRKRSDKEAKRIYLMALDNSFNFKTRRPVYIGRGKDCEVDELAENADIITDPNSQFRGYLSLLNCSRGQALEFSYISLDTAGKSIFEKKIRAKEEYNVHDGELVVYNEDKAYYALIHKGAKGKYHESNGIFEITKDGAEFFPLEIKGYVVKDYTIFQGDDGDIHFRGILSREGNAEVDGVFSLKFSVSQGKFINENIQSFDGEALKASIIEKKRIKPKNVDDEAPAMEYFITGTHLQRNGNFYMFAQNIEIKSDRIMQVATGSESVIRHTVMRDIMVIKMDQSGKLMMTEVVPSSNVYTNHKPHRGYSFAFHQEDLYLIHPSYDGDISFFDPKESEVNQPQTLQTRNHNIAVTIIGRDGSFNSKNVYDLNRHELYFDPTHVLYDATNDKIFVLARKQTKRRMVSQMVIDLPKTEKEEEEGEEGEDKKKQVKGKKKPTPKPEK